MSLSLRTLCLGCVVALGLGAIPQARQGPLQSSSQGAGARSESPTFADVQRLFYNARYEEAAALTLALRSSQPQDMAMDELRTSALLFQLKALLETPAQKETNKAGGLKACGACPALLKDFFEDIRHGQGLARAQLQANPGDETALFFLGKLNLNYVWLQLGPLRRRTGWDEYWEARRSLDAALKKNPRYVRARVARAWIDYIVDNKMPWGTRWLLGGGSTKRALSSVGEATTIETDFFSHVEAEFALWDMRVREKDVAGAMEVARRLVREFPENRELAAFMAQDAVNIARPDRR